jgi:hypothetical protein
MAWDTAAERELWQDICYKEFYWFVRVAFGIDQQAERWHKGKTGKPHWFTPRIHKPMCEWFQEHALHWLATREAMYLVPLVPRFFGKTTIFTQAGQLWLHIHDPEVSTYTGSENSTRASEFVEPLKKIISGDEPEAWFTYLFGNWYDKNREWRKDGTTHGARKNVSNKNPSFGVWGVERGLTGMHPDAGILDDPTSYEAMGLHSEWFKVVNDHIASLTPVFGDTSFFMMPGTRYGDGDHFGYYLRKFGIKTLTGMSMPDLAPREGGRYHVYYLQARDHEGIPIYPERASEKFLSDYEADNNLRYYAQMMNDPASSEFNPFTRAQSQQVWCSPKDVPKNIRVSIHLDTAFKSPNRQARGDESVLQWWGHSRDGSGDVYYLGGKGSNIWRMEDFLRELVIVIQQQKALGRRVFAITDETEPGGKTGVWEYAIRTACHAKGIAMPVFFPLNRAGKQKVGRIITAASYWTDGYVRLVDNAMGAERLVDQMVRIGNSAHDDWADAAADVFNPSVYTPAGKIGMVQEEAPPYQPGDEVLKGWPTNPQALKLYDRVHSDTERGPYEPV